MPEKPEKPEQPSTPSSGTQTLSNGKAVTEENVAALLEELKEKYPHKGYYDVSKSYYFAAMNANGHDCAALAFMVSDDIFGTEATLYSHQNYESIKLGDIIEQGIFEDALIIWFGNACKSKVVWVFGNFLCQITIYIRQCALEITQGFALSLI